MIYPSDFEQKIGFDRIRRQTERLCASQRAREILAESGFMTDFRAVETALARCHEMREILLMEDDFPQDHFVDIHAVLRRVEAFGAYLLPEELVVVRRALTGIGELTAFLSRKEEKYLRLNELLVGVEAFPETVRRIDTIIDRFGAVKDTASAELQAIRRAISERQGQASKVLNRILRQGQASGVIDPEASLSVRDGRTVIPVSAANKRKINGFIHDESATGKTFYIEPIEVVELNNELKELGYSEKREIVRILTAFTDELRPEVPAIRVSGEFLAAIDFLRAKARWALANDGVKPILTDVPLIGWVNARHPLLVQALAKEGKKVVPLTLALDRRKHILVISGPNAGGKSVALKTVALLQYMLQCGFLIPASENSETGIFQNLFLDMGDEQSIDNDLSTYSSHLLNMKTMLRSANEASLVLIDEFGSGTEPVMGAAIAEAVLQKLEEKRVFAVITTHYANLKYYAAAAPGILNGAMAFDVQKIEPLFRLEIGKPGSSFAIEIARKIGLPEEIIRSATEKAGDQHVNIERQLREIARDKRYWEGKRDRIRIAEKRADELAEQYARELDELKAERGKLLKSAKEESRRLLDEANKSIEQTIREIRQSQADREKTKQARGKLERFKAESSAEDAEGARIEAKIERLREREANRMERKIKRGEEPVADTRRQKPAPVEKPLAVGDKVRIKGQNAIGEITQLTGAKAVIGIGQILTTIDSGRLERISPAEFRKITRERQAVTAHSAGYDTSKRRLNFHRQIDLRGERAVDALGAVREYIDEAVMLAIPEVKILHGKGTGALKEEIRRYLSTVDAVVSATDEDEKFGGAGITVVRLEA
ncbi:MAG: Smr/MutS family protein [Rikenellaceae bacterium]|jgi:DNA mismatch repair protein MutS2|nr:Smr/MutS family protein [Rikenellaceae bacterium]